LYGFVTADSKDYFVHFSEIQSEGFKTLKEGDAVSFDIAESEKGLKAVKVQKM
jgi:CspA family cold shock protein